MKKELNDVLSNTVYQVIGKVISGAVALFSSALITRGLGAELFGDYSIVLTYVLLFFIIADFGVNAIVIRTFAVDKNLAKEKFMSVLTLRGVIGIILTLISVVILVFMPYADYIKQAILISLPILIFQSIFRASGIIFQSYLKYKEQTISISVGSLITLLGIWILIKTGNTSVLNLTLMTLSANIVTAIISIFYVKEYLNLKAVKIDLKYWKYLMADAFPLGIALLFNTLMVHIDRLTLSIMSTPTSVGIYSLAYKIFDVCLVLVTFFMNAMYPILIKARETSLSKYILLIKYSILAMLSISVALTIGTFVLSPVVIPVIWGDEMMNSLYPLEILMVGSIIFYITSPLSWVLLIEGGQKSLPRIYAVGMIINTVLNIIFIPMYDYNAAAMTTVVTEFIIMILLLLKIQPLINKLKKNIA